MPKRRYLKVLDDEGAPPDARGQKQHAVVRFEWTLAWPTGEKKEHVDVRSDNAKGRKKVPLPQDLTKITANRVRKECERAPDDVLRHWPPEFRADMPTVRCQFQA